MKKTAIYLVMTLFLVTALCGCGDDTTNTLESPTATTTVTSSPTATADIEDGVVDDSDGVIGNEGTSDGTSDKTTGNNNTQASASPSTSIAK